MTRTTAALLVTLLLISGCGTDGEDEGTADCSAQVRLDGTVYTSHGFTSPDYDASRATRIGDAEVADCHDVGEHAAGSVFTDDPREVAVWAFEGYRDDEVVGVRTDGTFAVYVAETVPAKDRDRIFEELAG